ncbi:MAG: hypothetical protein WKF34_02265 [Pyrinomonadaceae bacterium]
MKLLSVCLLLLSGVASAQSGLYLIPVESKFSSDARVVFSKDPVSQPISSGSENGVAYKFNHATGVGFLEGSKGVGVELKSNHHGPNWELRCENRLAHKQCGFKRGGFFLISYVNHDGPGRWSGFFLMSGSSPISLTVDGRTFYVATGGFATDAIEAMGSGKEFTVRYSEQPDDVKTFDLYGFNEAKALSQWALKQIEYLP